MDTKEALAIVEDYRVRNGHPGTLEALTAMKEAKEAYDLTPRELAGFNVAFAGFRRLFFGGEA